MGIILSRSCPAEPSLVLDVRGIITIPLPLNAYCSPGHGPITQVAVQSGDKSLCSAWSKHKARSSELLHPTPVSQTCWQAVRRVNSACFAGDFEDKRVIGPGPEMTRINKPSGITAAQDIFMKNL